MMIQRLLIITSLVLLSGCSSLMNVCKEVKGPVSLNIQGSPAGGAIVAKVEKGGEYKSYPMREGKCVR